MTIRSTNPRTKINQQSHSNNTKKNPKNPNTAHNNDEVKNNESSRQSNMDLENLMKVNINPSDATRVDRQYPTFTLEQIEELQNKGTDNTELRELLEAKTEKQKAFDCYRDIIEKNGGTFLEGSKYRNIVGLRNENLTTINENKGVYDDQMVMLWTDDDGNQHIEYFAANTEPSARYDVDHGVKNYGVDANGDGKRDLGRMPAGYREFKPGYSDDFGDVLRPVEDINAERDADHNGKFDDGLFASAGKSMIFHKGGENITGSAGCQTLHPDQYEVFWEKLTENGKPKLVGYTIVDNSTLE